MRLSLPYRRIRPFDSNTKICFVRLFNSAYSGTHVFSVFSFRHNLIFCRSNYSNSGSVCTSMVEGSAFFSSLSEVSRCTSLDSSANRKWEVAKTKKELYPESFYHGDLPERKHSWGTVREDGKFAKDWRKVKDGGQLFPPRTFTEKKHRRGSFVEGTGRWAEGKNANKGYTWNDAADKCIDRGLTDWRHGWTTAREGNGKWVWGKNEEESPKRQDIAEEAINRDAEVICNILEEGIEEYSALKQRLAPFARRLSPQLVCRVIANSKDYPVLPVIRFFSWTGVQRDFRHNSSTYDEMINYVGKINHFKTMTRSMKKCKSKGFSFTPRTFSFVIERGTLNSVKLNAILQSINEMNRWKKRGDNDAYDALLSTICSANQLDTALVVLRGMVPAGYCPRVHTYNIVMSALCREGKLEEAKKLVEEMKDMGCSPTVITYNRLLNAYIQKNKLNEASALVGSMIEAGCCADSFTYTQLIEVACRSSLPDEGLKLLNKMLDAGLKPTQAAYNLIVECFRATDHVDEAHKLLVEMIKKGYG